MLPAATVVGCDAFVTVRSACRSTRTLVLTVVSVGLSGLVTPALLGIGPAGWSGRTVPVTVMVTVSPARIGPSEHRNVATSQSAPGLAVAGKPESAASMAFSAVLWAGPSLVTVTRHVDVPPAITGSMVGVLWRV